MRVAQFTTNFDAVQIGFYSVMKQYYGPGGSCPSLALDWNGQMLGTLQSYVSTRPNYRHYVAQGQYHTILRSPQFYTEASGGVGFTDWMAAMPKQGEDEAGGEGQNDGQPHHGAWRNAACPGCLFALPCP